MSCRDIAVEPFGLALVKEIVIHALTISCATVVESVGSPVRSPAWARGLIIGRRHAERHSRRSASGSHRFVTLLQAEDRRRLARDPSQRSPFV